ncbi:FUSC family protein [Acidovorax sacchari]|uniref:FUSC family protein n=1 Tax=Acidovorax sacchari TaxID=3230736 RepID=UPI0039E3AFB9
MRLYPSHRLRAAVRVALSHYVANGVSVALGLLLISVAVHVWLGAAAAAAASVGVIVCSPPDLPGPRRGKLWQMLPAPLLGIPLFFAVQWLHGDPLHLGLLLVPGTFLAFLAMAWGRRGIPIAVAVMFSMIFSMAAAPRVPPGGDPLPAALAITAHFALGAGLYVLYAVVANRLLNARYRVQIVADTLYSLAALMRVQARLFDSAPSGTTAPGATAAAQGPEDEAAPHDGTAEAPHALTRLLLRRQAALAEQLQGARNIVLEAPSTPARQRLAAMLVQVLETRDHLLACELDVEALKAHPGHVPVLRALRGVLLDTAAEFARLADALLRGSRPAPFADARPALAELRWSDPLPPAAISGPSPHALARGLADRVGHINDEALRMNALARGEAPPDLAVVRASWQMFVSPTAWSWAPLATLWRWDAPPLRHAVRAALAIAAGFLVAQALPWGTHAYWILLTIVVVLRGSLAQTLERRNSRVAGTLLGCVLAAALLAAHLSSWQLVLCLTVAQAVAHAFAVRRYLVTAVAATVLGLVQSHMLHGGTISPAFDLLERLADTLIGTGIAWAFSYVLPSWERSQIPALVQRTLGAQARHAREALALGQLHAVDNAPELAWRLARREAYDSLSALVQATERAMAEPRAVQPPVVALEHLQARCYQLLAQLTAIKTMLLLRRGRLDGAALQESLAQTAEAISRRLEGGEDAAATVDAAWPSLPGEAQTWPDPHDGDLGPWMVRRLALATERAGQVRAAAREAVATGGS